jgi:restriction system protein
MQRQLAAQRRAEDQATRAAARAAEQERKDQAKAYVQSRQEEAVAMTAAAEHRMTELEELLKRAVAAPLSAVTFEALKKHPRRTPLDLGADAQPIESPSWTRYQPLPPGPLSRAFGGERRYALRRAAAERIYSEAVQKAQEAEIARQQRVVAARRAHAEREAAAVSAANRHNASIETFAGAVRAGDRHGVSKYFQQLIDMVVDPEGFPRKRSAGYVPESTLLAIEWYLPSPEIVPSGRSYRWMKSRDEIVESPRPIGERRRTYQQLVAQIALRALRIAFESEPQGLVGTVVFNGLVDAIDPVTGQEIAPCLVTLRATREQFEPLVLSQVDPLACIRKHFHAEVSRHPDELQAIPPVMEFKMADPRIIDPVDIISQIDKRPNLLELTPKEFEHFIHNLFDRMGFDTKIFKADGDGGVDCVAYDPTPIRGGKYVIQVKLYSKTVPPTAVRDLYGTMQHEGAQSGILITTSGFGPSSYEFASGKPLQLIDGSGLLALCKEHNIPARIVPTARS